MDDELKVIAADFARFQATRKSKREPVPLVLREKTVDLMKTHRPFLVSEAVKISKPVLYKWRKELSTRPRRQALESKTPASPAFIEVIAPMPAEPEGPTAVWEHPQRGRLVFSGLTASIIPALMQGFLGEARQ